jgi:hypothetical protein
MRRLVFGVLLLAVAGCVRAVRPLRGTPVPTRMPAVELPRRPMQIRFTWVYGDDAFSANGDGVVRTTSPDRARLDFFLRNGSAGGYAILIRDSVYVPGADMTRKLLPPVPMLWAALNRLSLPPTPDTVARMQAETLFVDLGTLRGGDASKAVGEAWRLAFAGNRLMRADRIDKGRVVESMSRQVGADGETIRYNHESAHRRLTIVLGDTTWVERFDEAIWRR